MKTKINNNLRFEDKQIQCKLLGQQIYIFVMLDECLTKINTYAHVLMRLNNDVEKMEERELKDIFSTYAMDLSDISEKLEKVKSKFNELKFELLPEPKTRSIEIEPWFFRYLNEGQLKVLSAILAQQDNTFASNRTIAFYTGFGTIRPGGKEEKEFLKLNDNEQKQYKLKKLKNAIQTVKNTKKQLEKLGVITREIVGDKSYAVVNLEWGKERYLKEFDEYFNEYKHKKDF